MGIILWLGETIFGIALKGLFSRFFPSKDEKLGELEAEVKNENAVIQSIQEKQKIDQSVAAMSDADAANELRKWERD